MFRQITSEDAGDHVERVCHGFVSGSAPSGHPRHDVRRAFRARPVERHGAVRLHHRPLRQVRSSLLFFFKKTLEYISPFCGALIVGFGHLVMSALGLKAGGWGVRHLF